MLYYLDNGLDDDFYEYQQEFEGGFVTMDIAV